MVMPSPQPPATSMTACASCGTAMREGARFCPSCGAPAGPARCTVCAAELRPGARFCGKCGQAVGAVATPAVPVAARSSPFGRPSPVRAPAPSQAPRAPRQGGAAAIAWGTVAAGVGFALALLGAFSDWITTRGASAGAFEDNAEYRIGRWLDYNDQPIDGIVVLLLAVAGLALVAATLAGKFNPSRAKTIIGLLGPALFTLGILEMQYITSEFKGSGINVDWGLGLWLIVIGGIVAAVSGFIPQGGKR